MQGSRTGSRVRLSDSCGDRLAQLVFAEQLVVRSSSDDGRYALETGKEDVAAGGD
jgi:hypothetical protein